MIRKLVLIVVAVMISYAPGAAQISPPQPPKKPAIAAPALPKRARTARAPVIALPEIPEISIPEFEMPALPEIPELPTMLEFPALPAIPALPALPDLSALSALSGLPAIGIGDFHEFNLTPQEQSEKAREKAERDRERAEEQKEREQERREREQEKLDREEELYDEGTEAIDEGRWDRAAEKFAQVVAMKGKKADGALYWKAYAENKQGHKAEAVTTLTELQKNYPKSNYVKDSKALEIEIRGGGTGPAVVRSNQDANPTPKVAGTDEDCELKLLAINSLMQQDSERAVPMLEKVLQTGIANCPKARKQALFVLAQSGSPRARTVIEKVARGQLAPELQREAINYLGLFGGHEGRAVLKEIYESSNDTSIKKKILQSFMVSGEKDFLLGVARNEKDAELRAAAVQQLGVMGAREELWLMYRQETTTEVKAKIINAMFVGGDAEHMIQLAKSEKDADLRKKAINNLGLMGSKRTGDALVELYTNEKDTSVRKGVLNAFFLQGNARQLVEVARKETDPELKRAAVQKLSLMGSKEAMDYLMEILNKP